ncbi:uncharacterized protein F4817DRAFT_310903 [Daldinia loculata]|uniref:uncharacterized protein n=1 Tax=Daldinia loculata TaxID=103429 RepID=UPI0020C4EECB|nr:uncharacterized protein F4817DRAFT_310903 [Daldinia loculata]KAI1652024.1 hypothetical protein F4817DRAFT_310903 [Daldinia loculata]
MLSLSSSANETCKFINLPNPIRHLIYRHVGLPTNTFLYLDIPRSSRSPYSGTRQDLDGVLNLLLVCRAIHVEVSSHLYSANTIVTHSLGPLISLNTSSLSYLTSLKIHLNVAGTTHCGQRYWGYDSEGLRDSDPLISQWKAAIDHIAPHIKPRQLELALICDCEPRRANAANLVLAPLRQLPILRRCHIRLGCKPHRQLRQLAWSAAERAVGLAPPSTFQFLRLPPEIRIRILEYTDLVTPFNKIRWNPGAGYHTFRECDSREYGPPYCHPNDHRACVSSKDAGKSCLVCPHGDSRVRYGPESHCWRCFHYACQFYDCERRSTAGDQTYTGCFCSRRHAAYSPLCRCWAPPTAFFFVSRAFREAAEAVFFAHNHFVVRTSCYYNLPSSLVGNTTLPPKRYPGCEFLSAIPIEAIRHLRSLEIIFDDQGHLTRYSLPPLRSFGSVKDRLNLQFLQIIALLRPARGQKLGIVAAEKGVDYVGDLADRYIWPLSRADLVSRAQTLVVEIIDVVPDIFYYLRSPSNELPIHIQGRLLYSNSHTARLITGNLTGGTGSELGDSTSGMHDRQLVEGFCLYSDITYPEFEFFHVAHGLYRRS